MKKTLLISISFLFILINQPKSQTSWEQVSGIYGGWANKFVSSNNKLYATFGASSLYISNDNGENWDPINSLGYVNNVAIFKDRLYATGSANDDEYFGLLSSDDDGENWEECYTCPETFFDIEVGDKFMIASKSNGRGIFRTYDGINWVQLDYPSNWSATYFKVKNNQIIFGGRYSYYSENDGNQWQILNDSNGEAIVFGSFCMNDSTVVAAYDDNIFYWKNKSEWISLRKNLSNQIEIQGCYISGDILFVKTNEGSYYLNNANENWVYLENTPVSRDGEIRSNSNYFYHTSSIGIFRSMNLHESWEDISQEIHYTNIHGFCIKDHHHIVLTDGRLFISSDDGESWEVVLFSGKVDKNNILSNTFNQKVYFDCDIGLYEYDLNTKELYLDSLAPDFHGFQINNDRLYAYNYLDVYHKEPNNSNWIEMNYPSYNIEDMIFYQNKMIVSNGEKGVYTFAENQNEWKQINNGIYFDIYSTNDTLFQNPWKMTVYDNLYGVSRKNTSDGQQLLIQYLNDKENRWNDTITITNADFDPSYLKYDFKIIDGDFYISGLNIYKYSNENLYWEDITEEIWTYSGGSQKNIYQIIPNDQDIFLATEAGLWKEKKPNKIVDIEKQKFKVFPNITSDYITIKGLHPIESKHMSLWDLNGNQLDEFEYSRQEIRRSIKHLAAGFYFIKINGETHKIIKI